MQTIYNLISESLKDALPIIPILLVLYFILEYFSHSKQLDLINYLKISGPLGPLAGTILGIIPQCGMSVFVTSLFLSRKVTVGTLVATYLATSDEAIPVFISQQNQFPLILKIIVIKFALGITSGYILDFILTNKFFEGKTTISPSSIKIDIKHELEGTNFKEIFLHALKRTIKIFLWVLLITFVIAAVLKFTQSISFINELRVHPILQIVVASIFGIIPNCAASVAIAEAYIHAGLSFSATIAGLSVGAGYGPIVLIKEGGVKIFTKLIIICVVFSIIAGMILLMANV